MRRDERKSVKIDAQTAKDLLIEKAHTGTDIYELIRQSWALYKREKSRPQTGYLELPEGITPHELVDIIQKTHEEDSGPTIGIRRMDDGRFALFLTDPEDDESDHARLIPLRRIGSEGNHAKVSAEERQYAAAAIALLREDAEDKAPLLRLLLKPYLGRPLVDPAPASGKKPRKAAKPPETA